MWLVTTIGFFSVVEHNNRRDAVLVRARVRADLERLLHLDGGSAHAIESTPTADYPYRKAIHKKRWQALLHKMGGQVDYPNFKAAVATRQGPDRARVYHELWNRLLDLEREDPTLRETSPWRIVELDLDREDPDAVKVATATAAVLEGLAGSYVGGSGHPAGCDCDDCVPF